MNIQSISCVYFSPTGATKKIVEKISESINAEYVDMIDITKRSFRKNTSLAFNNDMVIIASPVYYGRIPEEIVSYLKQLKAEKIPVVLVVTYGNREVGDALKELSDIVITNNFIPFACGSFIAEHSYSSNLYPIAKGRPDSSDLAEALEFGRLVRKK